MIFYYNEHTHNKDYAIIYCGVYGRSAMTLIDHIVDSYKKLQATKSSKFYGVSVPGLIIPITSYLQAQLSTSGEVELVFDIFYSNSFNANYRNINKTIKSKIDKAKIFNFFYKYYAEILNTKFIDANTFVINDITFTLHEAECIFHYIAFQDRQYLVNTYGEKTCEIIRCPIDPFTQEALKSEVPAYWGEGEFKDRPLEDTVYAARNFESKIESLVEEAFKNDKLQ